MRHNRTPNTTCARCEKPFYCPPSRQSKHPCCSRSCSVDLHFDLREQQVEQIEGMSFPVAIQVHYFDRAIQGHVLCKKWGMQYRTFRALCGRYGIEMKTHSAAVKEQWVGNDHRRAGNAATMRETMSRIDTTGDNNPAKRPEVRAKISAYKTKHNPMHCADTRAKVSESLKRYFDENPTKHLNYRMAKSHLRSGIEVKMQKALRKAGIEAEHGHRIGRLWPDLIVRFARLVVECDGVQWHTAEADAIRDARLNAKGWHVIHVTDIEINQDIDACVDRVESWLLENFGTIHSGTPLPRQMRLLDI